ncbi:MAG: NADH-quinone oxidoreductase subunit H [Anaerolineales bacterium]|nr:NADH-quinone oxidoreductase subunit H [Anaerolineales bacterium]
MQFLDNLFLNISQVIRNLVGGFLPDWGVEVVMMTVAAAVLVVIAVVTMMFLTWMERKVVGRIQDRLGPNRVGPFGLMQPIADMVKMFIKEDITPREANRWVYNLGPIVVVPPAILALAVIPFGRGLSGADLSIGWLYLAAVASTSVIGIFMAGWGSRNKYALLGAMRAAAQIVSYEIPQVLSVVGVILIAGSLSMQRIVEAQNVWFVFLQPVAFIIFLIASVAEIERSPFDLPEAESEIIAGYHTEYSGLKFGMFFLAEYISTFAVSAIGATMFLGGWRGPVLPGWIWFLAKTYLLVFVVLWLRGTLPRIRVDQLMNFAWKVLVPLALANLLVAGLIAAIINPAETPGFWTFIGFLLGNLLLIAAVVMVGVLRAPEMEASEAAVVGAKGALAGQ